MSVSFVAAALGALALAPGADARVRRRFTGTTIGTTNLSPSGITFGPSSYTLESKAECKAVVSAATWSNAVSSAGEATAKMMARFCDVDDIDRRVVNENGALVWIDTDHKKDVDQLDGKIKAVAKLLIESKIECTAEGRYAEACGRTWAEAKSFAGAAFQAFAESWTQVKTKNRCGCDSSVFAQADVVTSAWADIWVQISAGLDDYVCANTDGFADPYDTQDEVTSTERLDCVGKLVMGYWAKAIAEVHADGHCIDEPLTCDACCLHDDGSLDTNCDLSACKQDCLKHVTLSAAAFAKATITSAVKVNTSKCEETDNGVTELLADSKYYYNATVNDDNGNSKAECFASAYAHGMVEGISTQVDLSKRLVRKTCDPSTLKNGDTAAQMRREARGMASAYLQTINSAYTDCMRDGGDDGEYDGGCAVAESYTKGYAEACAVAIAESFAKMAYNADSSCDCTAGAKAVADVAAKEAELLFVGLESTVMARVCAPDADGTVASAFIEADCFLESAADLFVRMFARVATEGECITKNKAEYCSDQCAEVPVDNSSNTDEWSICIEQCNQDTYAKATAIARALATIDVEAGGDCIYNGVHFEPGVSMVAHTLENVEFNGYSSN